ncbi:nickel-dependent lactate racemase [candidate division KSB1 bacterium]
MAVRKFQIPYGKKEIEFVLDRDDYYILDKRVTGAKPQSEIVLENLNKPINFPAFEDYFKNSKNVAVVIPDKTRKSGTHLYLPLIIEKFNNIGISSDNITLFFANGTHGKMTDFEKISILGEKIFKKFKIFEHDCTEKSNLTYIGTTKNGTKIHINTEVLKYDKILLTGSVNFHYMAGFGGGLKTLIPGLAGLETALKNHSFTIDPENPGLNPLCVEGVIEKNPLFDDIFLILDFISPPPVFNTILNDTGEIINAVFGHPVDAFKSGCKKLLDYFSMQVTKKADLIIMSPGGYPKDINLIQTHKSINRCWNILSDNGILIVAAECIDGIGSSTFLDWFEYHDITEMHKRLNADFKMNGNTALSYKIKINEKRIFFVSNADGKIFEKMGLKKFNTLKEALDESYNLINNNQLTYLIPNGSYIFPVLDI